MNAAQHQVDERNFPWLQPGQLVTITYHGLNNEGVYQETGFVVDVTPLTHISTGTPIPPRPPYHNGLPPVDRPRWIGGVYLTVPTTGPDGYPAESAGQPVGFHWHIIRAIELYVPGAPK